MFPFSDSFLFSFTEPNKQFQIHRSWGGTVEYTLGKVVASACHSMYELAGGRSPSYYHMGISASQLQLTCRSIFCDTYSRQ